MRSTWLCACVLLACGPVKLTPPTPFSTGRGTSIGAAKTVMIGATGGALATDDGGVKLEVPAGALGTSTALTLEPITCLAPGCTGEAWRFGPDGTTFATPATLRFQAQPTERGPSLGALGVAFQDAEGFWHWIDDVTRDEASQTLTVSTTHLSDWSMLAGLQIRPLGATVKTGQNLELTVKTCLTENQDGLATLMANCDGDLAPLTEPTAWTVNGTKGGNSTYGTVKGEGLNATFTAPGRAPNPPTVAITATVPTGTPRFGKTILYSQVTIGTPEKLSGTVTIAANPISIPVGVVLEATVTLTLKDEGLDETNYLMNGNAEMKTKVFSLGDLTCVLKDSETTKPITHENFKIRKQPQLAVRWGYQEGFTYTCSSPNGQQMDWLVLVAFMTGTGPTCQFFDVPISDAAAPAGRFASSCGPYGPATAEWNFHSE